jgi:three-Cys-motif partner protein
MADRARKANGNCISTGDDGLAVQDVGAWALEKHDILQRYIEASAGPRGTFLRPRPGFSPWGAGFIDLFAGPGRARVRETQEFIAGSPIVALDHASKPFSRVVAIDLDSENVSALRSRTAKYGERAEVIQGDCNEVIGEAVGRLPEQGLNLALIDPYGLEPLRFDTLRVLASVRRMDLIVHFPVADMKRNIMNVKRDAYQQFIDRFLGVHVEIKHLSEIPKLIDVLRSQLAQFGYEQEQVRSIPVCNSKNAPLYYLVYISKHPKGSAIWKSLARNTGKQRGWDF